MCKFYKNWKTVNLTSTGRFSVKIVVVLEIFKLNFFFLILSPRYLVSNLPLDSELSVLISLENLFILELIKIGGDCLFCVLVKVWKMYSCIICFGRLWFFDCFLDAVLVSKSSSVNC